MTERFCRRGPAKRAAEALRKHVAASCRGDVAASAAAALVGDRRHRAKPRRGRPARCATSRRSACRAIVIPRDALDELVERARRAPAGGARQACRGIKPERGDIILAGAVVDPDGARGRRLRRRRGHRGRPARGRLLRALAGAGGAVRRRAPPSRAEPRGPYHVDAAHTEHVARLALGHVRRARARRRCTTATRASASCCGRRACLHDIGMTVDYDDHHKHSRYLILNGGLPGLHAARGRDHRPGRPLPPQGHARRLGPFAPLMRQGRRRRCSTAARRCCAWPRTSSARATSSSARPTPASTTAGRAAARHRRRRVRVALGRRARAGAVRRSFWPRACRGVR